MSAPQNPYEPNNGSGNENPNGQNPNNQPPNAPGYSPDQNQPYGSQPQSGQQPPQYGSQPAYGQSYDPNAQGYDQNQGGYGQGYDPNAQGHDPNAQGYGQNQGYGQGYDANAQGYDQNQGGYGQGYDANQYGQQPAYAGGGDSDQFIPANPNAAYGSYPAGSGGSSSKNIWGILALIGGIVGIALSWLFGIGFLFGVAGAIFAFVGLSAIKKGLANNKGMTIIGMILSFVAILFSIISVILTLVFGGLFITSVGKAVEEAESTSPSAGPVNPSDPAQDPSEGAGDSEGEAAPPVDGDAVKIGTDLTATVAVRSGTGDQYATGTEDSNGDIAIVTITLKNTGSQDADLSLARLTADDGAGKKYDDVFDGSKYKGSLAFPDTLPAGSEKTIELAYGVPAAELDKVHLKLSVGKDLGEGKDFEFSKAA